MKVVEAAKHEKKPDAPDQKALTDAAYAPGRAWCCLSVPLVATPMPFTGLSPLPGWATTCTTNFQRPLGTWLDVMKACEKMAADAASSADAASKRPVPQAVKSALGDLASASGTVAKKVKACVAAGSPAAAPPTGPSLPVGPNGACDDSHLCGPGLECRGGQCKPPCACPPGCFVEGGACKKNVVQSRIVRKDCAKPPGMPANACPPPPCFKDGAGACKIDTTETSTTKESCALVCP